jgi:prephenate dehydrogenase
MTVTIIGIGLIGGSMAIAMRESGFATSLLGVEESELHAQKALERGLVDRIVNLKEAVSTSDFIVVAVPVNDASQVIPLILSGVKKAVVMDVGSTKSGVLSVIKAHPNRGRFVATHPMWGTEYSGPEAAMKGAFVNKATVICNREETDADALEKVEQLYKQLGMHLVYMEGAAHDLHVAYVSHISHITSFALANTVLEKERADDAIFELASGGFESTVRLAKSSPAMWVPILKENRENVLDVLNEHISQLRKFKACLEKENYDYLKELIEDANKIRRILK